MHTVDDILSDALLHHRIPEGATIVLDLDYKGLPYLRSAASEGEIDVVPNDFKPLLSENMGLNKLVTAGVGTYEI